MVNSLNAVGFNPRFSGISVQQESTDSAGVSVYDRGHGFVQAGQLQADGFHYKGEQLATLDGNKLPAYGQLMSRLEAGRFFTEEQRPLVKQVVEAVKRALGGQAVDGVTVNSDADAASVREFSDQGVALAERILSTGLKQKIDYTHKPPNEREVTYFVTGNKPPVEVFH